MKQNDGELIASFGTARLMKRISGKMRLPILRQLCRRLLSPPVTHCNLGGERA